MFDVRNLSPKQARTLSDLLGKYADASGDYRRLQRQSVAAQRALDVYLSELGSEIVAEEDPVVRSLLETTQSRAKALEEDDEELEIRADEVNTFLTALGVSAASETEVSSGASVIGEESGEIAQEEAAREPLPVESSDDPGRETAEAPNGSAPPEIPPSEAGLGSATDQTESEEGDEEWGEWLAGADETLEDEPTFEIEPSPEDAADSELEGGGSTSDKGAEAPDEGAEASDPSDDKADDQDAVWDQLLSDTGDEEGEAVPLQA